MILFDYVTPSALRSEAGRNFLGFTANGQRPVRFKARIKEEIFMVRTALRALGEVVWSDDTWFADSQFLDPIATVHPDRVFFEVFSSDQSVYAQLILSPELFEPEGDIVCGTTNVDFTGWLWAALGTMRSRRETYLSLSPEGLEVETRGGGARFERKVDVPQPWARGFLQLQAAMAMPGTRLRLRPVDLLAAIRFLSKNKARVSPRALRYEFRPDGSAELILEPWEEAFPLKGVEHGFKEPKTVRVWGRRRLKLLAPLLPFASSVDVYLKGRGLPSFYVVHLPGMRFVLGLTGWSAAGWTSSGGFSLLVDQRPPDLDRMKSLGERLESEFHLRPSAEDDRALFELCRLGRAVYDLEAAEYRSRNLFPVDFDVEALFPPDPTVEEAIHLADQVELESCVTRETSKVKRFKTSKGKESREIIHRDWVLDGSVGPESEVHVVVSATGRIIFGKCGCPHFQEHLLNQGPCAHMLALFQYGRDRFEDEPTSKAVDAETGGPD